MVHAVRRLLLGLFVLAVPIWMSGNTLTKAYVRGDRLMLDFSHGINPKSIRTFRLVKAGSVRYVFDCKNTRLGSPRVPKGLHHPRVSSFRISQYHAETVRIVIETPHPYPMAYTRRSARTYAIALPPPAQHAIGKLFSGIDRHVPTPTQPQPSRHAQKKHRAHAAAAVPVRRRYTVILDPGHGGRDTGAIGGHRREKDLVLQIAKRVRRHLQARGLRVIMTRRSDRFVRLSHRTHYANRKHGDIFVSIHANAIAGHKRLARSGVETYYLQTTRSDRARRVAARENNVVLKQRDRLSKNVILNAVMTGPKIVLSNKLAIDVQRHILANLHRRYRDVRDGGVRPAPFWVLVGAEMPAVLVETGYISNPKERQRLFNSRYQELLAKGIAEGVANYLHNREREME